MCFSKQMANLPLLFTLILLQLVLVTFGITISNFTVPYYGVRGGSVQLFCSFSLETPGSSLLVLKWYRLDSSGQDKEFFRFTPGIGQNILTFPVDGIYVDIPQSSMTIVTLKNITLETSGTYKCEVSAEKTFITKSKEGHMIVIAPPLQEPEILGVQSPVSLGEKISGNCSSYRSRPAVALFLYVNGEKAPDADLIEYSPVNDTDGLETSVLGFNFTIEPRHFSKPGMKMELKCTATIGNFYWIKTMSVAEGNVNAQPSFSGHNRNLAGGAHRRSPSFLHMSIIQGTLLCGLLFVSSIMAPTVVCTKVH